MAGRLRNAGDSDYGPADLGLRLALIALAILLRSAGETFAQRAFPPLD